jgi:hypothetical protein
MDVERVWRSGLVLGVGAAACGLFALVEPIQYRLVRLDGWSLVVLFVLAAVAIAAGTLRRRQLLTVAGVGFLAAAALQLAVWGGSNPLGGDGSTVSLFAGFGLGLLALGLAPVPDLSSDLEPSGRDRP